MILFLYAKRQIYSRGREPAGPWPARRQHLIWPASEFSLPKLEIHDKQICKQ